MIKIGLLSDTHSYLDERIFEFFDNCDEIWHAGDIGTTEIIDKLKAFKPCRFVFGNIDSKEIQLLTIEDLIFEIEGLKILMTHIANLPSNYNPRVKKLIVEHNPNLLICGHSHILRVIRDPKKLNLVYINPGAAGNEGFHQMRTVMKFEIEAGKIQKMEVIELGKRGLIPKINK